MVIIMKPGFTREELDRAIRDDSEKALPFSVREGDFIRPGYHPKVDELRDLLTNASGHIVAMEVRTKEQTLLEEIFMFLMPVCSLVFTSMSMMWPLALVSRERSSSTLAL